MQVTGEKNATDKYLLMLIIFNIKKKHNNFAAHL